MKNLRSLPTRIQHKIHINYSRNMLDKIIEDIYFDILDEFVAQR